MQAISEISEMENGFPSVAWKRQKVREDQLMFDRLWTDTDYGRLSLHRLPAQPYITPFWHPHARPTGVFVLEGWYELNISSPPFTGDAHALMKMESEGPFFYEMTHAQSWHAIKPITVVTSVMLVLTYDHCKKTKYRHNQQAWLKTHKNEIFNFLELMLSTSSSTPSPQP